MRTVQNINDRFLNGFASNDLWEAGVLLHHADAQDNGGKHWLPSGGYADRLAGSVINRKWPYTFSRSQPGFIANPDVMQGSLYCASRQDQNSMGDHGDHGCHGGRQALKTMLSGQHAGWYCACARGTSCDDRNGCQYNEVEINAYTWTNKLPRTVEAIFYPGRASAYGIAIHNSFLADYGLQARDCPLLEFDYQAAAEGRAPFRQVRP